MKALRIALLACAVLLAVAICCNFIQIETTTVPEWSVQVTNEDGQPVPTLDPGKTTQ